MQLTSILCPIMELLQGSFETLSRRNRQWVDQEINAEERQSRETKASIFKLKMTISLASSFASHRSLFEIAITRVSKEFEDLLSFAAKRDFSAENVLFLKTASKYFARCRARLVEMDNTSLECKRRKFFEEGAFIFYSFLDPATANQPVNIDHHSLMLLQSLFSPLRYAYGGKGAPFDPIAPWNSAANIPKSMLPSFLNFVQIDGNLLTDRIPTYQGDLIPEEFSPACFAKIYEEIRIFVFHDTWRKWLNSLSFDELMGIAITLVQHGRLLGPLDAELRPKVIRLMRSNGFPPAKKCAAMRAAKEAAARIIANPAVDIQEKITVSGQEETHAVEKPIGVAE